MDQSPSSGAINLSTRTIYPVVKPPDTNVENTNMYVPSYCFALHLHANAEEAV
jgi:hypothetical protein